MTGFEKGAVPVLYEKDSKQLVLSISVHREAKMLLKMIGFLPTYHRQGEVVLLGVFYYRANGLI